MLIQVYDPMVCMDGPTACVRSHVCMHDMYVCMYVHIYVCMYVCMHACIRMSEHTHALRVNCEGHFKMVSYLFQTAETKFWHRK
jgi:hypothetical protein